MYFRLLLVLLLTYSSAVNIKRIDVPRLVALGSADDTILDCDYSLGSSTGLVVKWFFNENSKPVYQWIPPHKPQDMGLLKGKIDLTYKVSDDPLQAHRALRIIKPAANMSGNYLCVVSTFEDEDYKSKTMLVFSPGEKLTLISKKIGVSSFNLLCTAEKVYPQPTMSISSFTRTIKDVKSDIKVGEEGLFDIASSVAVDERDELETEEFVCEMRIPQANYTSKKMLTYYHGLIPTAQLAATENKDMAENDSTARSIHVTVVTVGLLASVL